MVRFVAMLLWGALLIGPQTRKPVALTVELNGTQDVQRLLDGLEKTDAKITFFLGDAQISPELTQRIAKAGHEMGLTIHSRESGGLLSRRDMAAQIVENREAIPGMIKPHWLRLEEGFTDGAGQVARVKNMAILAQNDGTIREGGVTDLGRATVDEVLLTVNRLQGQGYQVVTVSELARLNRVRVRPGRVY